MMPNSVPVTSKGRRLAALAAVMGLALTALSAAAVPERAWASALLVAFYLVTLGLGGAVFLAIAQVTGAGWHVAIRRVPEALTSLLTVGGALLLALLAAQFPRYAWHHHGDGDAGTFWFKELWLSPRFFLLRAVAYVVLWIAFARRLINISRRQDRGAGPSDSVPSHPGSSRPGTATAAVFLAVFAVTFSLAAVDWIMALEPMWYSTMWGVYHFSGLFLATLAALVIAGVLLRRAGPLRGVFRDEHLHDLGKLLLGFSCFWAYIWFCQYMLIWYSNIPEETVHFARRIEGGWGPMIVASLALNWLIPFFALLPRARKRDETTMLRIAGVVLVGRWVDLSIMIYPPVVGGAPPLGVPEVAGAAAGAALACWLVVVAFNRANAFPTNDPFLEESLNYRN